MTRLERDLRECLEGRYNAGLTVEEYYLQLTPYERFEMWLQWQGIIGYTDRILEAVVDSGVLGNSPTHVWKGKL